VCGDAPGHLKGQWSGQSQDFAGQYVRRMLQRDDCVIMTWCRARPEYQDVLQSFLCRLDGERLRATLQVSRKQTASPSLIPPCTN
jgi:hypothetical protein